jgi:hypothetical protein
MDGDGVDNDSDCRPRDEFTTTIPAEVTAHITRSLFWWDDPPNSTLYDVFRGTLATGIASATCIAHDHPGNAVSISSDNPGIGQGYFYLVRGTNPCGVGTLGTGAGGAERVPGTECP